MTDQTRADFEAHFQLTTRQAWTHPDGSYKFPEIQAKWEGYLAGVAKAAPNPLEGWDKAVAYVNQRWPAQTPAAPETDDNAMNFVFARKEMTKDELRQLYPAQLAQLAAAAPGSESQKPPAGGS